MKRPTFFLLVCFLTLSTLSLETGRAGFGGGPVLLRLSHSLGRAEAPPWRDERRKPHLTSPPKPWMMPPLAPPGPVGTHRGDAMMPGHGVAHRSGKSLLGTAWRIPSPSFLDELVRGRWWWGGDKDRQGMPQTLEAGSPPRDLRPDRIPARLPRASPLAIRERARSSWPLAVAAGRPSTPSRGRARRLPACGSSPKASRQGLSPAAPSHPLPPPRSLPGSFLLQSYLGKLVLS